MDLGDQLNSLSNQHRKCYKWYRKVGFELLLGTAVSNSYLIYKNLTGVKRMTMINFRKLIIKDLLNFKTLNISKSSGTNKHLLVVDIELKKESYCKKCYKKLSNIFGASYARKHKKRTKFYCNRCMPKRHVCLEYFKKCHN